MPGKIILAGGNEMRPGCEEMDERVLRDAGGSTARVVFLPTAVARHDPRGSGRGALCSTGSARSASAITSSTGARRSAASCARAATIPCETAQPSRSRSTARASIGQQLLVRQVHRERAQAWAVLHRGRHGGGERARHGRLTVRTADAQALVLGHAGAHRWCLDHLAPLHPVHLLSSEGRRAHRTDQRTPHHDVVRRVDQPQVCAAMPRLPARFLAARPAQAPQDARRPVARRRLAAVMAVGRPLSLQAFHALQQRRDLIRQRGDGLLRSGQLSPQRSNGLLGVHGVTLPGWGPPRLT